jgi:TetR/AcrR family transcriptional regulator, regulator of autoinduction and epiphytic fitness
MMTEEDGRGRRSDKTRQLIVDAWLSLVEEGQVEPTAQAVADRADVGRRTVFMHFQDLDSLQQRAAELHLHRIANLLVLPEAIGDFEDRLSRFVPTRVALFERATPLRRAAAHAQAKSVMANSIMAAADLSLGLDASRLFAEELMQLSEKIRPTVESALHVSTSWAAWNQLRARQQLDITTAAGVMAHQVRSLIGPRES